MASLKNIPVQDVRALENERRLLEQREFCLEHVLCSDEGEA